MNPQKKSIPKSNQTNSKMPYPIQPYPSLPLSTSQSKKIKNNPKELRTPNSPIHHDPQPQSHHNPPRPAMIHIDSKPNRTWKTHKLIKPTPDLRDPQPMTHTRLREPRIMPNLMHPRTMKEPWSIEKMRSLALAAMARERWDERAQTVWEESFSGRQTWESEESGRQLRE